MSSSQEKPPQSLSMQADVCQSFEDILVNQVKKLSGLQLKRHLAVYVYEHQLEMMFHTMYNAIDTNLFSFRKFSPEFVDHLEQLARICLEVINSTDTLEYGRIEECHVGCKIWSHKFLIALTREPFELKDKTLLEMIHDLLVKKVQIPDHKDDVLSRMRAARRAALAAYCLSQSAFDGISSPEDVDKFITDKVLPLAVRCLIREAKQERATFKQFHKHHFHGLFGFGFSLVCNDESVQTYPIVIRLLSALTKRSPGYRNKFESMLEEAIRRGNISDQDIVALNVLVDHRKDIPEERLAKLVMDLLAISEGLKRAHILYLSTKCQRTDSERSLAETFLNDLISNNDELLNEIALRMLCDTQYDSHNWKGILAGKEIQLIDKLIDMNVTPDIYYLFLKQFSEFKDSPSSILFDDLALRPISQTIDKLHHLMNLRKTHHVDLYRFADCLGCLKRFVQLRKHRLDPDQEVRLNRLFELLLKERLAYNDGDYLVFANSFQVYPKAWESILEVMRLALTIKIPADYPQIPMSPDEDLALSWQLTTNRAFPHLLLTDTDHFYAEIATPDVLELVYDYSKRAIDSSFVKTLLKEMMLTWPRDFDKTRLDPGKHQSMLKKFIRLLIDGFVSAKKNALNPRVYTRFEMTHIKDSLDANDYDDDKLLARLADFKDLREDDKMSEFLFALLAAFSFHRDAFHDVLDELIDVLELQDRDSWLKAIILEWTKLILDDGKQPSPGKWHFYGTSLIETPQDWKPVVKLDEFSNVSVASEALMAISGHLQAHTDLRESSGDLLGVIKLALQRGLERAPVGSLESNRYQAILESLPING